MTQLIVSLEENSSLADIKKAIRMLRGVVSVKTSKKIDNPNKETVAAMKAADRGDTITCESFEDYLELVKKI